MRDLTAMQAAYWVGRHSDGGLAGVSAHLYAEFDGSGLVPDRLRTALRAVCSLHPMLRLRLDAQGRQHLDRDVEPLRLVLDDMRGLEADALERDLAAKRRAWTHRKLDLTKGEAAAFGLSLLPGGRCRLHVDTDMIAIDPNSFRIVMEDLARLYEEPDAMPPAVPSGYFDWLDRVCADADLAGARERDRAWWRDRLGGIAPGPPLPAPDDTPREADSDRLAAWLPPVQRRRLELRARDLRITPSSLVLGLFAVVIGRATGAARFRLNVPGFWREPVVPEVGRIVGEFSNVLILSVDLSTAATLAEACRDVGGRLMELIGHGSYPGVSVMRDLSRRQGGVQSAPIVFTAGLGIAGGELLSERVGRVLGRMNWVISQGPQVALDAQVAAFEGGILVNFDIRRDALPESWIRDVFDSYVALLREVADEPARLDAPVWPAEAAAGPTEEMLIALHRRLAPGGPVGGDTPIAAEARAGLADFIAAYLPESDLSQDAIGPDTTPRRLARLIHERTGGTSDDIALIFLESMNEG